MTKAITKGGESRGRTDERFQSENGDLSKEEIFKVLSNQRRRWMLQYLKNNGDDPVSLRHMVDHVTARENGVPVSQIDSTNGKNVYTALKQTHLPKMHEKGIIDYDPQRGRIELTDNAHEAEKYLEYVPDQGFPWAKYYLGLSTIAAGLVFLNIVGSYPFGGLSWPNLSFLLIGLFGISSLVHSIRQRDSNKTETQFEQEE